MSRSEIASLLEMMRTLPPAGSIAELRRTMEATIAFHDKLKAAGCPSELHRYAEMPHAFMQLPVREGEEALDAASTFLRRVLRNA